jgi:hypothetical protein
MSRTGRRSTVNKRYKPRFAAWSRKTVRRMITFHKRTVRHAAKRFLRTGSRRDFRSMTRMISNWDFD